MKKAKRFYKHKDIFYCAYVKKGVEIIVLDRKLKIKRKLKKKEKLK